MDTFFRQKNHGAKLKWYTEDVSGPWSHKPPKARSQMCVGVNSSRTGLVFSILLNYGGGETITLYIYCHVTNHYPISLFFLFYPQKYYKPNLRWLLMLLCNKVFICFSWFVPILENPNRLMRFLISNYPVLGKMVYTWNPSFFEAEAGLWVLRTFYHKSLFTPFIALMPSLWDQEECGKMVLPGQF